MNYKARELRAKIAASFVLTKTGRRQVRDKIRFSGLIESVGKYDFPQESFSERINVSFCFDGRGWGLAAVAIYSLLESAHERCNYDIYLVVDDTVSADVRKKLMRIVKNTGSTMTFLSANNDFDKSKTHNWPRAVYYRMMLPRLLPKLDRIIYADIDTIFFRDLSELWRIDMGNNLVAGVRERGDGYINSGVLMMNLKQIRQDKIYEKWVKISQQKDNANPDQDLLNDTARGRIIYLPPKYNFQSMMGARIFRINTPREIYDLRHNLVVMHYSNWLKPWHAPENRPIFSEYWWTFARHLEQKHAIKPNI